MVMEWEEVRKKEEGSTLSTFLVGANEHLIVSFAVIAIGGDHFSIKENDEVYLG